MVDLTKSYSVSTEIVSRINPNGTVVLMKMDDSEIFYKIDGIAAEIWKNIAENNSLMSTVPQIVEKYDCTEEQVKSDISTFISKLLEMEIIS